LRIRNIAVPAVMAGVLLVAGCGDPFSTEAQTVNENLVTEADQFNVQRKITGVNAITDAIAFEVEGKCSFTVGDRRVDVICKHGPEDYRKHTLGLGDNVYWVSEQQETMAVDAYRTKIVIRPEAALVNPDIVTD